MLRKGFCCLDASPAGGKLAMERGYVVGAENGMKKTAYMMALACCAVACFADTPDFDKYQVILDRKPFGTAPPPESNVPAITAENSFAKTLRMSALLELDDGTMKIGLIDLQSNKSFYLAVGDTEEGIELVSADYDQEEAVVRKGAEMAVIKLQSGDIQALTPAEQQARLSAPPSRRPSYAERRAARQQMRAATPPPAQPKYTGEELERHLQEYQMEVIRQGLPPLPIPLTPEMDNQLVNEGVLPPVP